MCNYNQSDKLSIFKHSLNSFYEQKYLPAAFVINLTYKCNLACDMCIQYGDGFKRNSCSELSLREWEKFIGSVAWFKPRITLLGGEPLIYPQIRKLLKVLYKHNCQTELVTNGYFLEEYLDDIYDNNVDLFISIDGTANIHNRIRNSEDSFERILCSLKSIKQRGTTSTNGFSVNFVLLPDNIDNLLEFLKFIDEYNPRLVILQHPTFSSHELNKINSSIWHKYLDSNDQTNLFTKKKYLFSKDYIEKLAKLLTTVQEIKKDIRTEIYFSPGLSHDEVFYYYSEPTHPLLHPGRICSRPWRRLAIKPNGDALGCLGYSVGNITTNSFSEIWTGEKIKRLRQALLDVERFPICTRCCDFYNDRDYLHLPT